MDVIVGGGVAGLSVAWRLARSGRPVTVVDPAPASGASHAAAGMLAPASETDYTEESLLRLGVESLRLWPSFAAELAADAAPAGDWAAMLDYRTEGTLDVGFDADDLAALDELASFMDKLGLPVERLTGRQCRRLEPMLAPSVRGGIHAPQDAWVDPRKVTAALLRALGRRGGRLVRARAEQVRPGAVLTEGGEVVEAERVVLAAGAWSGGLADVPVRPVKGQILRLRSPRPLLSRCVRGLVHGRPVYLVPRGDGELVVGATQEELGFDTTVTAGGVYELLRDARELVPGVTELELAESVAGLRPGTPDNLPLIGPHRGLTLATGHHRGGVLLAPLTAAIVLGEASEPAALCSPERFL
ncbi:glycine oxidase ThiO [Nonomuraea soli]|uniref:glycine oxidase n=1 Tax=Nonomuraea soli TaxID=1032476 RepID=A0A7W0HNA0_9ACTN|nr:glycine oxidase ThiO [Nonomuraea soli]MBA2889585.1 glycine oxidase [Nonomuraea soli]